MLELSFLYAINYFWIVSYNFLTVLWILRNPICSRNLFLIQLWHSLSYLELICAKLRACCALAVVNSSVVYILTLIQNGLKRFPNILIKLTLQQLRGYLIFVITRHHFFETIDCLRHILKIVIEFILVFLQFSLAKIAIVSNVLTKVFISQQSILHIKWRG